MPYLPIIYVVLTGPVIDWWSGMTERGVNRSFAAKLVGTDFMELLLNLAVNYSSQHAVMTTLEASCAGKAIYIAVCFLPD